MEERHLDGLEKVGLTRPEARAYLSLIELKESSTGPLCDLSQLPSSKIYSILTSLMSKGFVTYRLQNNIKIFMPSSPAILKDVFEQKQKAIAEEGKEIERLVENLKSRHSEQAAVSHYKYFEGISNIKSVWIGLIEDLKTHSKDEPILMYTGVKKAYESMLPLYEEFHVERVKHKIPYKIIYPLEDTETSKKRRTQLADIRYAKLQNEAEWGVIGNKFFIQYITQKVPRGFLIEDEVFAKTFKQVFEQVFNEAKR